MGGQSNDPSDLLSLNVRLTHLEGDTFYELDLKQSVRYIGIYSSIYTMYHSFSDKYIRIFLCMILPQRIYLTFVWIILPI